MAWIILTIVLLQFLEVTRIDVNTDTKLKFALKYIPCFRLTIF